MYRYVVQLFVLTAQNNNVLLFKTGGSLVEVLQSKKTAFEPEIVCRIFYQICKAVSHMHSQTPEVIHRDLKIENLLISGDGVIKLCDFGSATLEIHRPDITWSANQRSTLEENVFGL